MNRCSFFLHIVTLSLNIANQQLSSGCNVKECPSTGSATIISDDALFENAERAMPGEASIERQAPCIHFLPCHMMCKRFCPEHLTSS